MMQYFACPFRRGAHSTFDISGAEEFEMGLDGCIVAYGCFRNPG